MTAPAATPAADEVPHGTDPLLPGLTSGALETGAAVGAAGLALTSTGSMVVAVVFLAVATRSRWTLVGSLLAVAAVAARFSTVSFDDIAGIQSVLGSAGTIGPATAAASAWAAAAAVLLSLRAPTGATGLQRVTIALAGGALAAAIAAGPGPGGELVQRVGATVVATVLAFALTTAATRLDVDRVRVALVVVVGIAALVLAAWPA